MPPTENLPRAEAACITKRLISIQRGGTALSSASYTHRQPPYGAGNEGHITGPNPRVQPVTESSKSNPLKSSNGSMELKSKLDRVCMPSSVSG